MSAFRLSSVLIYRLGLNVGQLLLLQRAQE
jgi:hypothetical protein